MDCRGKQAGAPGEQVGRVLAAGMINSEQDFIASTRIRAESFHLHSSTATIASSRHETKRGKKDGK